MIETANQSGSRAKDALARIQASEKHLGKAGKRTRLAAYELKNFMKKFTPHLCKVAIVLNDGVR